MNKIPHHLSEKLFRYFEPHIKLAVDNWPQETCFDLDLIPVAERYSPATFTGRFRDAIVSLKHFGWTTYVNTEKLWSMSGAFCIWWEPGTQKVWMRARGRKERPTHFIGKARERGSVDADGNPSASVVPWKDCTKSELASACLLIANRRIAGPILIEGPVSSEQQAHLGATCDIAFTWDEKRGVTVIT